MSARCASRSTILPLPSSPHCAPTMTVAGTTRECARASGRSGRAGSPLPQRRRRRLAHELDLVAALADDAAAVVVERERALDDRAEVAPARRLACLARRAHGAERRRAWRQDDSLVLHHLPFRPQGPRTSRTSSGTKA